MGKGASVWKERYKSCSDKRNENKTRWKKAENFYGGKHWEGVDTTYDDQISIEYIQTLTDTMRDSVYFRNPHFFFDATNPIFDPVAIYLNEMFPQLLESIMYKAMTKKVLFDCLRFGIAFKYNGYTLNGDSANDCIREDEVFSVWVPYDCIAIDKDANGIWDANYIFMDVWRGYDDVVNHPAYRIPKDFKSTGMVKESNDSGTTNKTDRERVRLIHVFDRGEGYHGIFTLENPGFLFKEGWPLGNLNYFPINELRFTDNKLYPKSFIDCLIQLNQEANKMESMKVTHAKRFNRKYHVKGGTLNESARKGMESGYDGAIIETDEDVTITPIQDADLNPAVYSTSESMFFLMKLVSRVGEYRFGTQPKGDTTATEAQYVEQGTSLGIDYLRDVMSDFCVRDAKILVALMRENYDTARFYKINGESQPIDRTMLEGFEYTVKVDCEGSAPPERTMERNEAIALMNALGADPFVNPIKPRELLLKTFKSVKDEKSWLNSPQVLQIISDSMQQGGPQVQLEAMRNYLAEDNSKIVQPASKWSR